MAKTKNPKNPREEKFLDFHKIGAIIQKNFIVMTRDKIRLIPLLAFPILMIMVLGFTSGNVPKHIPTAIIAYDNSQLSQDLQQQISNNQIFAIKHVVSTESEGRRLMDSGEVRVLIEIPPNLADDVNNNRQSSIIVIVDESDSAIAATSRSTLNQIINNFASSISMQKIINYQKSVDAAGQSLALYAAQSSQSNNYGLIVDKTTGAETRLRDSSSAINQYIYSLTLAIPQPTPIIVNADYGNITSDNSMVTNTTNVYFPQSASVGALVAQIAILRQTSASIDAAAINVHAADTIAKQSDSQAQALQADYSKKVVKSLSTIRLFTSSKASAILQPIVYEEKAAYGVGLKAIDFLLPSLIALTIFQGAVMGMGRSVSGEKRDGSLTRVFLTPTSNATIITGTLSFYILFELCRAAFLLMFSMILFNIVIQGSILLIILVLIIYITISTGIGMMISSMVKTEQQFMSMAMLISMPTLFLSGAFFPVQAMPKFMQSITVVLPATYAGNALRDIMVKGFSLAQIIAPLLVLLLFLAIVLGTVSLVFKRDIE